MSISPQGHTKGSRQTKIGQLEVTIAVNEQVLGFEITMQNAMAVAVADALHHLCHELLHHVVAQTQASHRRVGKSLAAAALADRQGLHVLLQVKVEELKHQVELVTVSVDNVVQLDNIRVLHLLEKGDLADSGTGDALIFRLQSNLLESNNAVGMVQFSSLVDDTVGS